MHQGSSRERGLITSLSPSPTINLQTRHGFLELHHPLSPLSPRLQTPFQINPKASQSIRYSHHRPPPPPQETPPSNFTDSIRSIRPCSPPPIRPPQCSRPLFPICNRRVLHHQRHHLCKSPKLFRRTAPRLQLHYPRLGPLRPPLAHAQAPRLHRDLLLQSSLNLVRLS